MNFSVFLFEAISKKCGMLIGNREMSMKAMGERNKQLINDNHTTLLRRIDMIACMFSLKPCIM